MRGPRRRSEKLEDPMFTPLSCRVPKQNIRWCPSCLQQRKPRTDGSLWEWEDELKWLVTRDSQWPLAPKLKTIKQNGMYQYGHKLAKQLETKRSRERLFFRLEESVQWHSSGVNIRTIAFSDIYSWVGFDCIKYNLKLGGQRRTKWTVIRKASFRRFSQVDPSDKI